MSIRRQSSGDSTFGPVRADGLKVSLGRLMVVAVAGLALFNVAAGKRNLGGGKQTAAPAASAAGAPAIPTTLTKSLAIDGLVEGLVANGAPAAEKTLEQMVTGEIA